MAMYLRPRRGKKTTAIAQNIILKKGEIFFESPDTGTGTGAGKIKIGDGSTTYADLPYFNEGMGDTKSQIESIRTELNGKQDAATAITVYNISEQTVNYADGANHAGVAYSVEWGNVQNKPTEFTPAAHNHNDLLVETGWFDNPGGTMFNKQGIYVFSVNPDVMPAEGAPGWVSNYGTIIVYNRGEYKTAFYLDVFGASAVWNSMEQCWRHIPIFRLEGSTLYINC